MLGTKLKSLPDGVQKFYSVQESKHDLGGISNFTVQTATKEIKMGCISIVRVKLWNNANINSVYIFLIIIFIFWRVAEIDKNLRQAYISFCFCLSMFSQYSIL